MNNKQLAIVAGVVAVILAVIIVLLVTGGPPEEELAQDGIGDVVLSDGPAPPKDQSLADVRSARVYFEASQIVFEAEMASPIPKSVKGSMSWRWEILEGGSETWIVSANLTLGPTATVIQQGGEQYGAGTIDDTLPGGIDVTGNRLFVRLNGPEIKDFPTVFTWRLETSLDGDRGDVSSAVASDTAPQSGLGQYPPP